MTYIAEVEDILDEFDFEKVQKVMEFLEWNWCDGVPRIGELRKKARYLLSQVHQNALASEPGDTHCVATGGFKARAVKDYLPDDGFNFKVYMELTFEVTSWDNYD